MEIIILPYMAISFFIGWAIFSPFADLENIDRWTFAQIEMSDVLSVFLPVSFLLAFVTWALEATSVAFIGWSIIAAAIFIFAFFGFAVGLYLLAKMNHKPPLKRMVLIGVIIPAGILLTLWWFTIPMVALAGSVAYSIPAVIAIVPFTWILRCLSNWVCTGNSPM